MLERMLDPQQVVKQWYTCLMKANKLFVLLVIVGVVVAAFYLLRSNTPASVPANNEPLIESQISKEPMYKGQLTDVTKGEVRQVNTNGKAMGEAVVDFVDGEFTMMAVIVNLPQPANDDFYEGWLVQKEPFKFISTGKTVQKEGAEVNTFSSNTDYSTYSRYVLTLEPNDGDPAPADHIVEGDLEKQN